MSQTIDNRVVEMRFDNRQFESNVATSMSTLDKLKQKLNFSGASKGLESINSAAKKIDMSGLGTAVESVKMKFSALEVAGVAALASIATKAVSAGAQLAKSFTLDPIIDGFNEYELKLNSIQTILANTQSKGTTMTDVTSSLDELNKYADQTIYNFAEMTRNIGTFTAAGVDLDTSVASIKGIANLAAISGSSSYQASTAMYQLSQALAAGRVSLMDWNSVVNAGMGGEVFQTALKRTAEHMGTNVDAIIDKYGSFRESLTEGQWLTTDVLTETLKQLSGAYTEADLIAQGYTESQAREITELARTAVSAATDVKTFSQLMDTSKEALQSGWAESWELIIGDFEESKELFSGISNTLGDMISRSADARNEVLQGWHDLGGRDDIIDSFKNVFEGLSSVVTPIKEAFTDIFPPITTQNLLDFSAGLKELTSHMKLSDSSSQKLKDTFKGLFSIMDIGKQAVTAVAKPLLEFATGGTVGSIGEGILTITAGFGKFFTKLNEGIKTGDAFSSVSDVISTALDGVGTAVSTVIDIVGGMGDALSGVGELVSSAFSGIKNAVSSAFDWIREHISADDIFAGLAGGGLLMLAKKISGLLDPIKEAFENIFGDKLKSAASGFGDILSSVHDSLSAFQDGIRVASLVGIATAITLLSSALETISGIDAGGIAVSLASIAAMMVILNAGFRTLAETLDKFDANGTLKASVAMIAMAEAINLIADAIEQLSSLSFGDIAQGLLTVAASIAALSVGINAISKSNVTLRTSVAIIALAEACKILADALEGFAELSLGDTVQGLIAMGGALAELVAVLSVVSKFGGSGLIGATSLLVAVQTLDDIAEALEELGQLSWSEIGHGLVAMGGALSELAVVSGLLGTLSGASGLIGAASLVVAVQSLDELADALEQLGGMSWQEIQNGLLGMGGALSELAIVTGLLGKLGGLSSFLGGGSLLLSVQSLGTLADALQKFGAMTFDEVKVGLVGMGGALGVLATITGLLGSLAGLPSLIGGGSLLLAVQGLGDLADALQKFGSMSWDEVINGLKSMAIALGATALGAIVNTFSGLGAAAIAEVAAPLGQLADSVRKWSGVSIPEGLGSQLSSLASGIRAFTFGSWGAETLSVIVGPLGQLASSVQKWAGVTVPEGLGPQLSSLASGIRSFTFGEWGAETIAIMATPLGTLADSVRKWAGVVIPEGLGMQLSSLASGIRAFTFGGLGAETLAMIVTPIGMLADSIRKWAGVVIPEGLGMQLVSLAAGVTAFTFGGLGAEALILTANGLSLLADALFKFQSLDLTTAGTSMGILASGLRDLGTVGITALVTGFQNAASTIATTAQNIVTNVQSMMTSIISAISSQVQSIIGNFQTIMSGILSAITSQAGNIVGAITNIMSQFVSAISSHAGAALSAMSSIMTSIGSAISGAAGAIVGAIQSVMSQFVSAISSAGSAAIGAMRSVVSGITSAASSAASSMYSAGVNIVQGLANGISAMAGTAIAAAQSIASQVSAVVQSALRISSPSKVFEEIGEYVVLGFVQGIGDKLRLVDDSGQDISDTIVNSMSGLGSVSNSDNALESFVESFGVMLDTINTMIVSKTPSIVSSANSLGGNLVQGFVQGIRDNFSLLKGVGQNISGTVLEGISNLGADISKSNENSTGAVTAMTTMMDTINAMIVTKSPEIIASMQYLMDGILSVVDKTGIKMNDLFVSILNDCERYIRAQHNSFYSAGRFLVEGLAQAIRDYTPIAVAAARALAAAVAAASEGELGISSPSRVFMEIGKNTVLGFVSGVDGNLYRVANSGSDIGDAILSSMSAGKNGRSIAEQFVSGIVGSDFNSVAKDAVSQILNAISNDMDTAPTIRPVLDLSDVNKKSKTLNSMFSRKMAASASSEIGGRQSSVRSSNTSSGQSGNSYQFIQNNYSPKALSRVEIYRRTKNQFSEVKGLIES